MKTIVKNINSSNEMKAQSNKCHTFSVLFFNLISFHYICRVCVNVLILDKLCNNFQKLWCSSLCGHTWAQVSKKQPSQIFFQQENCSSLELQESESKCEMDSASFTWLIIVKEDWQDVLNREKCLFSHFLTLKLETLQYILAHILKTLFTLLLSFFC